MAIVISGATGFIGQALCSHLATDHVVRALSRRVMTRPAFPGTESIDIGDDDAVRTAIGPTDTVINLAGESIVDRRWTTRRCRILRESRVDLTKRLVELVHDAPPATWIQASAAGYYGDCGDAVLNEQSPPGSDFLAELCVDWERAARAIEPFGTRLVILRIGVVLGPGGGALAKMRPLFVAGLGGRIGSGKQYVPWIHRTDLVRLISVAMGDASYRGIYNASAPAPVTNAELTKVFGRALGRWTAMRVPAFAARTVLGQAAEALLASQRALPTRAEASGFAFEFADVRSALTQIVGQWGAPG